MTGILQDVTAFELWYGAAKSARRDENLKAVEAFFAGPVDLWPFEDNDARAGGVRAALEGSGFGRITGLTLEDWLR